MQVHNLQGSILWELNRTQNLSHVLPQDHLKHLITSLQQAAANMLK